MFLLLNAIHFFDRDPAEKAYFMTSIVIWPIAGLIYGILTWTTNDASYRYFKSQNELDSLSAAP